MQDPNQDLKIPDNLTSDQASYLMVIWIVGFVIMISIGLLMDYRKKKREK